ncbi:hypothetical protein CAL26_21140 [Bordetella genomosp. 9]|uniref:Uncharacterized protein n=1 Tax=Bordetella genomosp. 9 TaxID=1416803 RepID=A0A261R5Z4_9BORD|nr:hypothetical protein [Bordetella genomosp. 9]OZI20062.1 hypothetical protein CAL26_21140 [Bordetella genomosp. 9]
MQVKTIHRLSPEAYRALEKLLAGSASAVVTSQTTDLQAGDMLGVQRVLKALRDGFVVEV